MPLTEHHNALLWYPDIDVHMCIIRSLKIIKPVKDRFEYFDILQGNYTDIFRNIMARNYQ